MCRKLYLPQVGLFLKMNKGKKTTFSKIQILNFEITMNTGVKKISLLQEPDCRNDNIWGACMPAENNLQASLPAESFIPFDVYRVKDVKVAFLNPFMDISEAEALEYAYAIKAETSDLNFSNEKKIMLAERYGGSGISTHGGGVRCGLGGKYQIKGVGTNPLVGVDSDFWHSHGSISLKECFYETLWGEVLNKVLPYGAIRCPAIILTSGSSWVKTNNGEQKVQQARALLVREPGLRPAHFERAYKYRPVKLAKLFLHDTLRTKATISKLPDALPRPIHISAEEWGKLPAIERLNIGLKELSLRVAQQTAFARAKRFMHGAPGSSNVCLDGKWIDYDTTSLISCYANVITGEGQRSFWEEHLKFYYIINEICFYIHKYYPIENKSTLPQPIELRQHFYKHFEFFLLKEFIKLTGIPDFIVDKICQCDESLKLATLLIKMARSGNDEKISCIPDDATRMGDYDLPKILFISACSNSRNNLINLLSAHISDQHVLNEFVEAYFKFNSVAEEEIISTNQMSAKSLAILRRIKTAKNIKSIPILYRHNAVNTFSELIDRYKSFDDLKEIYKKIFIKTMDDVEVIYGESYSHKELVWAKNGEKIFFDASIQHWIHMKGNSLISAFEFFLAFDEDNMPPELFRMREWWGSSIFNEFNIK